MTDTYTCDDVKYIKYIIDQLSGVMENKLNGTLSTYDFYKINKIFTKLECDSSRIIYGHNPPIFTMFNCALVGPVSIMEGEQLKNCNCSESLGYVLRNITSEGFIDCKTLHEKLCHVYIIIENYINEKGLNK